MSLVEKVIYSAIVGSKRVFFSYPTTELTPVDYIDKRLLYISVPLFSQKTVTHIIFSKQAVNAIPRH